MSHPGLALLLSNVTLAYSLGCCVIIAGLRLEERQRAFSIYGLASILEIGCPPQGLLLASLWPELSHIAPMAAREPGVVSFYFHIPYEKDWVENGGLGRVNPRVCHSLGAQQMFLKCA